MTTVPTSNIVCLHRSEGQTSPAQPRLLDLFSGQGGAAAGYQTAGFDVTGVDNHAAHGDRYPGRFIHADALDYLTAHGHEYDLIHASPPCQRFTHGNVAGDQADRHPDYLGPVRRLLRQTGVQYVIENVPRAPLHRPVVLCGTMFGLTATDDDGTPLILRRHRLFETTFMLHPPRLCRHGRRRHPDPDARLEVNLPDPSWAGVYGGARHDRDEARDVRHGGYTPAPHVQQQLMGITWMTQTALHQAIPPTYTHWIGNQARAHLEASPRYRLLIDTSNAGQLPLFPEEEPGLWSPGSKPGQHESNDYDASGGTTPPTSGGHGAPSATAGPTPSWSR